MGFADLVQAADRAVRDNLGGVPVNYLPADGTPAVLVDGIFDASFVYVAQDSSGVEQAGPVVWLRLDELPTDPMNDDPLLTIGEATYRIRERQVDSLGSVKLLLHLADI